MRERDIERERETETERERQRRYLSTATMMEIKRNMIYQTTNDYVVKLKYARILFILFLFWTPDVWCTD